MISITNPRVSKHYSTARRPPDLGVDNAFAVLTGNGELFLEAEGRHKEVNQGSSVVAAHRRPDGGGLSVAPVHWEILVTCYFPSQLVGTSHNAY